MNLIPRRVIRHPNQCQVIMSYKEMDRMLPDGLTEIGRIIETRQAAGRGWSWLGRMWLWRNEP